MLEGRLRVKCGEQEWVVEAGGSAYLPRGIMHQPRVDGADGARVLIVTSRTGFDLFEQLDPVGGGQARRLSSRDALPSPEPANVGRGRPSKALGRRNVGRTQPLIGSADGRLAPNGMPGGLRIRQAPGHGACRRDGHASATVQRQHLLLDRHERDG